MLVRVRRRGKMLILHDNDSLVPMDYAQEVARLGARGFQAARLQRLVFHLTATDSATFFDSGRLAASFAPEFCRQNCQGVSVAIERQAYFDLGGHDETFVGWGGEDNEFFDRLRTVRLYDHAYLPLVHLHHGPQAGKDAHGENMATFEGYMRVPTAERIAELKRRNFGAVEGPTCVGESTPTDCQPPKIPAS